MRDTATHLDHKFPNYGDREGPAQQAELEEFGASNHRGNTARAATGPTPDEPPKDDNGIT